jgi:hypothetical protein
MNKKNILNRLKEFKTIGLLIGFFLAETILTTWIDRGIPPLFKSILLLFVSVSIGVIPFAISTTVPPQTKPRLKSGKFIYWLAGLLGIVFLLLFLRTIHQSIIDVRFSDIIPWLDSYTNRLIRGETVYKPYNFGPYTEHPSWLPMVWMPYVVSTYLKFDPRLWALFLFSIPLFFYWRYFIKTPKIEVISLLFFIPYFVLFSFLIQQKAVFGQSLELLIAGYYLFFFLSILSENKWLIGLSLALCLLSRYSVSFWIAVPLFVYCSQKRLTELFSIIAVVSLMMLGIFIIPFLYPDTLLFHKLQEVYLRTTIGEWQHMVADYDRPISIYTGNGVACWFNEFFKGEVVEKIKALQKTQIVLCVMVVLGSLLYFFKMKNKIQHLPYFLLTTLKIYFALFYGFIQIPYTYLYLVPIFLSVVIVAIAITAEKPILVSNS